MDTDPTLLDPYVHRHRYTHACSTPPPSPRELNPLQLFVVLATKAAAESLPVSPLIGASTDNVAAAKEEFKPLRLRRRQLYIWLHRVIRGRGTRVGGPPPEVLCPNCLLIAMY